MRWALLLAAVIVCIPGCSSRVLSPTPAAGTIETPEPDPDPSPPSVVTTVAVTPSGILPGQAATILVTVKNVSTGPQQFTFRTGCQLVFDIRNEAGEYVAPLRVPYDPALTTLVLAPGQSKSDMFTWDGLREDDPDHAPQQPGIYRVRGLLCFPLDRPSYASQPVQMRLLPPPAIVPHPVPSAP